MKFAHVGQDAASISHHCANTNVVHKAVKKISASGTNERLDDKDLVSNQMSVDKYKINNSRFSSADNFFAVEEFSVR